MGEEQFFNAIFNALGTYINISRGEYQLPLSISNRYKKFVSIFVWLEYLHARRAVLSVALIAIQQHFSAAFLRGQGWRHARCPRGVTPIRIQPFPESNHNPATRIVLSVRCRVPLPIPTQQLGQ